MFKHTRSLGAAFQDLFGGENLWTAVFVWIVVAGVCVVVANVLAMGF